MIFRVRKVAVEQHAITKSMTFYRRDDFHFTIESTSLLRGGWKYPDGLKLVPSQDERCLTWDTTVVDTFALSYITSTSSTHRSAAEAAATKILSKYSSISKHTIYYGCFGDYWNNERRRSTLVERTPWIAYFSLRWPIESAFLYHRLSELSQRLNIVAFRGTFASKMDIEV